MTGARRATTDSLYRSAMEREESAWSNPRFIAHVAKILYIEPEVTREACPAHDFTIPDGRTVEAKIRWPPHYEDVLIETSHTDGTAGWLFHTGADLLLYLWVLESLRISDYRLYDIRAIREDWSELQRHATGEIRSAKNAGRVTVNLSFAMETLWKYEEWS